MTMKNAPNKLSKLSWTPRKPASCCSYSTYQDCVYAHRYIYSIGSLDRWQFCLSCSACPVLPVLIWLPCSASPVLPVQFCLFCLPVLFCLSHSAFPVLPVLYACPVLPILFCLSRFVYSVLVYIRILSCSACPILPVLFCLAVRAIIFRSDNG